MNEKRVDREAIRQAIIEEAEYWGKTDTADMMRQETEWFTFEWTEREDRCRRCGGGMDTQRTDLHPPEQPAPPSWGMPAVQRTPSLEPALVREDRPPYGEEDGKKS